MMSKNVFDIVVEEIARRTNDLQRPISIFRLTDKNENFDDSIFSSLEINLYFEPKEEDYFALTIKSHQRDLQETFYFYPESKCFHINVFGHVRRLATRGTHILRLRYPENPEHKKSYVIKDINDSHSVLAEDLWKIVGFLRSEKLVRVDPYNHENILYSEDTEADRSLLYSINAVKSFEYALENCEIKPGIINPEQDYKGRN